MKKSIIQYALACLFLLGLNSAFAVKLKKEIWEDEVLLQEVHQKALDMTSIVQVVTSGGHKGSGVLISDRLVLTNRHVIKGMDSSSSDFEWIDGRLCYYRHLFPNELWGFRSYVKLQESDGTPHFIGIKSVISFTSSGYGEDLAIIELTHAVNPEVFRPVEFYEGDLEDLNGATITGAGYGLTGICEASGYELSQNTKYYYETTIDSLGSALGKDTYVHSAVSMDEGLVMSEVPGFKYLDYSLNLSILPCSGESYMDLEGRIAPGDSGSGQFFQGKLVGLATYVSEDEQGSVLVVGNKNYDWIQEIMDLPRPDVPEYNSSMEGLSFLGSTMLIHPYSERIMIAIYNYLKGADS